MGKFIRLSIIDDQGYTVEFTSSSNDVKTIREKLISFVDQHLGTGVDPDQNIYDFKIGFPVHGGDRIKRIKLIREISGLGLKQAKELDDATEYGVQQFESKYMSRWDADAARRQLIQYYRDVKAEI